MKLDLEEESNNEFIQVPKFLPKLFVSPSCLPKFSYTIELVARKKAELLNETMKVEEAMQKNYQTCKEQVDKCANLQLEIECLENEAYVMRKELVRRIYLEVGSAKEMRAVNELRRGLGVGATPGMRCFQGSVYNREGVLFAMPTPRTRPE